MHCTVPDDCIFLFDMLVYTADVHEENGILHTKSFVGLPIEDLI